MGQVLLWSLIASVILTVLLNLFLFFFPNALAGFERRLSSRLDARYPDGGVRFVFPVKTMIIGSIALTVLLNLGFIVFA